MSYFGACVITVLIVVVCIRAFAYTTNTRRRKLVCPIRVAAVLGSAMLGTLPLTEYAPFFYIISSGDTNSFAKAQNFERNNLKHKCPPTTPTKSQYLLLPRARKVRQSWITTPFQVLKCIACCFWYLGIVPQWEKQHKSLKLPFVDVILMNGPGICVPIVLTVGLASPRLVYVESFARVRSLSMTGRILRKWVDDFIVQWPTADPTASHYGIIV